MHKKAVREFHMSRIMFAIKDDMLYVHTDKTEMSHFEWFISLGWINAENEKDIINSVLRGYVDASGVYFYRGSDFNATEEDAKLFIRFLIFLDDKVGIDSNLPVYAGVIKSNIGEKFKPKRFIGTAYRLAYSGLYKWDLDNIHKKRG